MKRILIILILNFQIVLLFGQNDFSFVFLPDTHLNPDPTVASNFDRVVAQINNLKPDFLITGGDMIYTAKNVDEKKAKVLFEFMENKFQQFDMPVYYTMGNHEIVGVLAESGMDVSHPLFGKGMYEKLYGKSYKSFTLSGWKYFLLDGIRIMEKERNYSLGVDSVELDWIKDELLITDKNTPLVIVIHPPLANPRAILSSSSQVLSPNSEAVLNLFKDFNLKMVLQGHNHIYMNLFIDGIHFVSGGSTSYNKKLNPFDDGFLFVTVKNNKEELQFIRTNREIH